MLDEEEATAVTPPVVVVFEAKPAPVIPPVETRDEAITIQHGRGAETEDGEFPLQLLVLGVCADGEQVLGFRQLLVAHCCDRGLHLFTRHILLEVRQVQLAGPKTGDGEVGGGDVAVGVVVLASGDQCLRCCLVADGQFAQRGDVRVGRELGKTQSHADRIPMELGEAVRSSGFQDVGEEAADEQLLKLLTCEVLLTDDFQNVLRLPIGCLVHGNPPSWCEASTLLHLAMGTSP